MNSIGTFIGDFSVAEKNLSDQVILKKVISGDTRFFEILVRRYNQRLYRVARSYFNDDSIVEDIMQESYIKAYENIGQFEGRAKFSTWLTRIVMNTALARLNQAKKFSTIDIDDLLEDENSLDALIEDQNHEQKIIRKNLASLIENAIDKLPEKYRLVFIMRVVENMTISDTAECLAITEENVKVRLFRARKLLRSYLNQTMVDLDIYSFYLDRCDRITKAVLLKTGAL